MGLENLSSVFSDISQNKPTSTSVESFQSKELIKISRIETLQDPSPLHDMTHDTSVTDNQAVKSTENIKVRENQLSFEFGKNMKLGEGKLIFDTLYAKNHKANPDRIEGKNTVIKVGNHTINTLEAGIGNLGNLNIKSHSDFFRTGLGFLGPEPYIVHNIPESGFGSFVQGVGQNRDLIPFRAALDDVSRLVQFYTSPAGIAFIGKDRLYGAAFAGPFSIAPLPTNFGVYSGGSEGVVRGKQSYDKANTLRLLSHTMVVPPIPTPNTGLLSLAGQTLAAKKPGISSLRKPLVIDYSHLIKNVPGTSKIEQLAFSKGKLDIFKGQPYEDTAILSPIPRNKEYSKRTLVVVDSEGTLPTPFLGLGSNPKHSAVDKVSKRSITYSQVQDDIIAPKGQGDFYVRIKDLRDNLNIYFRGYVTGITENVNPSFASTNYIGRSEPVYLYERGERDLSFNLKVYPANEDEFELMYEKINRLTSLAYPEYLAEVDNSSSVRMKAPFTELYMAHIGSRNKGQFGFIKSISYTVSDSGDWDVDTILPRLFEIAISYQILNKKPPSMNDNFYPVGMRI